MKKVGKNMGGTPAGACELLLIGAVRRDGVLRAS